MFEASVNGKSEFKNLLELIVCRENIIHAIRKVKSNSGFKTAGVDGETGQQFLDQPVEKILDEIIGGFNNYRPSNVKRVMIPKSNGKERPLGISTIKDRVMQTAVANIIEPILEGKFYKHSYGFRPLRSIEHATAYISTLTVRNKRHFVVEGDIKGYFDNINHKILLNKLWKFGIRDKRVIAIIKRMLKAGIEGITSTNEIGTPQGSTISTLLANVYLNDFDHWVSKQWLDFDSNDNYATKQGMHRALGKTNLKQGHLIRYADDWIILTDSEEAAIRWKKVCKNYLRDKLKIELSEEKTKITDLRKSHMTFLGIDFVKVKGKSNNFTLRSYPNMERLLDKRTKLIKCLREIRKAHRSNDKAKLFIAIQNYNSVVRGLNNFYRHCTGYNKALTSIAWSYNNELMLTKRKTKARWGKTANCSNLTTEWEHFGNLKTLTWIIGENTVGIVQLGRGNFVKPKIKAQWINPYSKKGREKYEEITGKRWSTLYRNPNMTLINLSSLIRRNSSKGNIYTLEYFINRPMAFNRDKMKCKLCKIDLVGVEDTDIHHIDPTLPKNKINKVGNLVTLCKNCHIDEHRKRRLAKKQTRTRNKSSTANKEPPKKQISSRPPRDELLNLIINNSYTTIGRMFKVSDNAVKKWAISYGIHELRKFKVNRNNEPKRDIKTTRNE